MLIGNLTPSDYLNDGKYKFKLDWGGLEVESSGINRVVQWTQTSWLNNSTISGFSEIGNSGFVTGILSTGFQGLGKSTNNNCVFDGEGSAHNNWWNCVGAINKYNNDSIPGPLGKKASSMHLYIWSP